MKFAVGTSNKGKLQSVTDALKLCNFPSSSQSSNTEDTNNNNNNGHHEVIGVSGVDSKVSPQPFSTLETRQGAYNRANAALEGCKDADFGIGLEGGIEMAQEPNYLFGDEKASATSSAALSLFVVGWVCVIHRESKTMGWGSSARVELPKLFAEKLGIKKNMSGTERELSDVIDEVSQKHDLRSSLGVEGLLTNGSVMRGDAYSQALVFALAKFLSPREIW